jgi:hypothetical protein
MNKETRTYKCENVVYVLMSDIIQVMTASERKRRLFMICDNCFWVASLIDADKFDATSCPMCNKQVSSTPIADNESYSYNYNERRGVEIDFRSTR